MEVMAYWGDMARCSRGLTFKREVKPVKLRERIPPVGLFFFVNGLLTQFAIILKKSEYM